MGQRDAKANIGYAALFDKKQVTATQTVLGTDVSDYGGAAWVVDVGDWTADDLTITLQESDDDITYTDVANADLDGSDNDIAVVTGSADTVTVINYRGNKKFIGAKITDGGTGDAVIGIAVVKVFPKTIPAS